MTLTLEFCEARAREAAEAADEATLENVRDRALRSEAAWRAMASRIEKVQTTRSAIIRARTPQLPD